MRGTAPGQRFRGHCVTSKRKTATPRRLKRNPVARALRSPLFREKTVEPPERPRRPARKPKHPQPLEDEADGGE